MRRKLVKQGQNALTVTVPAKWTKLNHLEAGDEVEIAEEENNLLVSGLGKSAVKSKTISIEDYSLKQIRSVIASAYKSGYTETTLKFKSPPKPIQINNIINSFTGLEIVSQGKNSLIIKSFLLTEESQIESLIVKMFQVIKLLASTIAENWEKVDVQYIESILKGNIIKIRDHCLRAIHVTKFKGDLSYDYYDFVTILEKISAELYYLALFLSQNKLKKTRLTEVYFSLLDELYQGYLKKDYALSNKLWNKTREKNKVFNEKLISKTMKKENPALMAHYYHLNLLYRHLSSRLVSLSC